MKRYMMLVNFDGGTVEEPMDQILRSSGQYGPRVPVKDNADAQTQLVAFIGRDPEWTPHTGRSWGVGLLAYSGWSRHLFG